jgi:prepilin-type N-terminal cleavage/methylation domain-containing protein
MKNLPHRSRNGFTLVELLIVISIIMVLAALGFAGVQNALKNAKKVQSLNMATNLAMGIQNFYDEYGYLPVSNPGAGSYQTNSGDGVTILKVLVAKEATGNSQLNTKYINYLTIKAAKGRKAGMDYGSSGSDPNGLYDAWGKPFTIIFDDDYNDEITLPSNLKLGTDPALIRGAKAIVVSPGADGNLKTKDDVRSF